jgi:hypothetical protein
LKSGRPVALVEFYHSDSVNHTPFPGATTKLAGHAAYVAHIRDKPKVVGTELVHAVGGGDGAAAVTRTHLRAKRDGLEFTATGFAPC